MSDGDQQKMTDPDPLEEILKKSGCWELHCKAKYCINNTEDYINMCKKELNDFNQCMWKEQERIAEKCEK